MEKVLFIDENQRFDADLLVIVDRKMLKKFDRSLNGAIHFNLDREKTKEIVWMTTNGTFSIPKIAVVNEKSAIAKCVTEKRVAIAVGDLEAEKIAFEILLKQPQIEDLVFLCTNPKRCEQAFRLYAHLLETIQNAKKLIEAPANKMPPARFAEHCLLLEKQGVKVEIFDEKELKKMGAEAILSVGQGSVHPPRLVVIRWQGASTPPIALVGKGVCFDAGGIQLKSKYLTEMKWDKAGAGVVVGVIDTLARLQAPIDIVGVIPLAENMPDGAALKPGDVISTLSGKSVEIADTDAEGRLLLADALTYAQRRFRPEVLIDLGTLTLETLGALGSEYAGLFCNDPKLEKALIKAGKETGEKLWPLPLGEYYAAQIRSKIADVKNEGIPRYGASSAAAEFLRTFVEASVSWAHLDISGVAWNLIAPEEGVSGFGIRLLVNYLLQKAGRQEQECEPLQPHPPEESAEGEPSSFLQ